MGAVEAKEDINNRCADSFQSIEWCVRDTKLCKCHNTFTKFLARG